MTINDDMIRVVSNYINDLSQFYLVFAWRKLDATAPSPRIKARA